jgi:septum site-determining protein MinC
MSARPRNENGGRIFPIPQRKLPYCNLGGGHAAMLIQKVVPGRDPVIKGSREGLRIIFPIRHSFEEAFDALAANLAGAGGFFEGARSVLEPSRELTNLEADQIKDLLAEYGLELSQIRPSAATRHSASARMRETKDLKEIKEKGTRQAAVTAVPAPEARTSAAQAFPQGEQALLIRNTVRSGQKIQFDGNITVLGDVNPGAEIIAAGDILVFGALKGTAHAGSCGDRQAVVAALRLRPVQLRIAELIVRAPDKDDGVNVPEIAQIRNDAIVVEPFASGWNLAERKNGRIKGRRGKA